MNSHHLPINSEITVHYRENHASDLPPLLLLHSLSDNTHVFDPVIDAGLDSRFRVIAPDLRGRGISSRPATGYGLEEHCADLIALLDHLGVEKAWVAGHSFGGLLGLYFAAHYPHRTLGLAMIDAAVEMHPMTPLFVVMLADRLGKWYLSRDLYLSSLRAMPFMTRWDDAMAKGFLADVSILTDDSVLVNTRKMHITQCAVAVQMVAREAWREWALRVTGPSLVMPAKEPFLMGQHLVSEQKALETAVLMHDGEVHPVSGNHVTMLFGAGATEIAAAITARFSSDAVHKTAADKAHAPQTA